MSLQNTNWHDVDFVLGRYKIYLTKSALKAVALSLGKLLLLYMQRKIKQYVTVSNYQCIIKYCSSRFCLLRDHKGAQIEMVFLV